MLDGTGLLDEIIVERWGVKFEFKYYETLIFFTLKKTVSYLLVLCYFQMCMDMVSFETKAEETFVHNLMKSSGIKDVHTSGRLCDGEVEGCDQPRFQPLHINGWFWASSLKMMPPTNQISQRFVSVFIYCWFENTLVFISKKLMIPINLLCNSITTGAPLDQAVVANPMEPSNLMDGATKRVWHF